MDRSKNEATGTPVSGIKRRIDYNQENISQIESKKLNLSQSDASGMNLIDRHVLEAQVKEYQAKLSLLEHQVKSLEVENKAQKSEINTEKEKIRNELIAVQEQKYDLEQALKKTKTNEKFYFTELEHLRGQLDKAETELAQYKNKKGDDSAAKQLSQLIEDNEKLKSESEKTKMDLQADIKSKDLQIEQLNLEVNSLKDSVNRLNKLKSEFETIKNENAEMQNKLHDAEIEISKAKDSAHLDSMIKESNRIAELERQNKSFISEIEYLKAIQEKAHLYKEEMEAYKKQIDRYEERIVKIEIENSSLNTKLKEAEVKAEMKISSHSMDKYKEAIKEVEERLKVTDEKLSAANKKLFKLENELNEKSEEIKKCQKKMARLSAERNGYKNIVEMSDSDRAADANDLLMKRVKELETIISEYRMTFDEADEQKLSALQKNQNQIEKNSIEIQVNLAAEMYANYEKTIQGLREQNERLQNENRNLEEQLCKATNVRFEPLKENRFRTYCSDNVGGDDVCGDDVKRDVDLKAYQDLERKYNDQVKLNQRRMEEFERKCKEVLGSFKRLSGFKATFYDKTIKLTSIYSRDKEDNYLVFTINSDRSLSMVDSKFASKFPKLVENYVRKHDCVPAFLAAITFHLLDIRQLPSLN